MELERVMTRREVLQALSQLQTSKQDEFGIVRIGIFGSVARGSGTDESDIDVVVELAHPDLLTLVGIKQELEDRLHCPVDIVRYRENMNTFLKQRIEQEAIYV
jgi:predicted nucleotidyltransferase